MLSNIVFYQNFAKVFKKDRKSKKLHIFLPYMQLILKATVYYAYILPVYISSFGSKLRTCRHCFAGFYLACLPFHSIEHRGHFIVYDVLFTNVDDLLPE